MAKRIIAVSLSLLLVLYTSTLLRNVDAAETITIIGSASYLDSLGWYHVVGELRNDLSYPAKYVEVIATFYDSKGVVVGTTTGYASIDVLRPGEKSPFHIILFDDEQSLKVSSYKLASDWNKGSTKEAVLQIKPGQGYYDVLGWYHLVGEITNNGKGTATYVEVVGTLYDKSGKVLDAVSGYTDPSDLEPGETAPYHMISFTDTGNNASTASINAQSVQYASIMDNIPQSTPQQTTASPTITVSLSKTSYKNGETITVKGKVTNADATKKLVYIEIQKPTGEKFTTLSTMLMDDGSYTKSLKFTGPANTEGKTYKVNAKYDSANASTSFSHTKSTTAKLSMSSTISDKTKVVSLSLKNPIGGKSVYKVIVDLPVGVTAKSATTPAGWTKSINTDKVTFSTTSAPLKAGSSIQFKVTTSKTIGTLQWDAYDSGSKIIQSVSAQVVLAR